MVWSYPAVARITLGMVTPYTGGHGIDGFASKPPYAITLRNVQPHERCTREELCTDFGGEAGRCWGDYFTT